MNHLLRKKGSVLVFSLLILAIVLSSALSITMVNVSNRKSAASTAQSVQSFQVADTAAEKVLKAIYNGNFQTLDGTGMLYSSLNGDAIGTCPNPINVSVSGGIAKVSFYGTDGLVLTVANCSSVLWRDSLASVKVEGSTNSNGAVRVLEIAIAPLSSMAWGENGSGRLGDGTTTERHTPVSTIGGSKWKSVSAANFSSGAHVLAVKADGTLWAWGENGNGQLGDGDSGTDKTSPVQIGTDNTWESVSAGESHSLAIKTDHSMWAWGNGADRRLGTGNASDRDVPVRIAYDNSGPGDCVGICPAGWKFVSAGSNFSLAIGTDDSLWSWGDANNGRLGHGENGHKPAKVVGSWKMVSAGNQHSLGIKKLDDSLWAWGSRAYGKVGDNSSSGDALSPVPIQVSTTWQSISAGFNHSLGVRMDGTLWAWGRNIHGQLGSADDSAPHPLPEQIGLSTDWKFVSAGNAHGLALKTNGANQELWSWGYNGNGQVGDNSTTTPHPTLYQVPGNWKLIDGGSTFSIAVRE